MSLIYQFHLVYNNHGLADKELDIVEMAVYGDVIRPGNQCRCRSVAEMLGKFKSRDHLPACKLPNSNENLQV